MSEADYQRVIDALQALIDETQSTLERFETAGMVEKMPQDYGRLLAILDDAVKQQRAHTLAMLNASACIRSSVNSG
ncbi:hypothetical protein HOP54_13100 [Halomonas daqingensis]|uniref:Uncharacterized protein n=1 Tax=Billgrantia desiderata TaxID=52021 RepID=A0AAW4YXP8_9GAMM|nr:hypothetical protein [Halomonas desiderata]MCE8014396.1 hypothetical protein [Halomonas desiderata]MCE8029628.1 hypothetical protein [Halomonas desiderata]MCE8053054.1 hypothetical protein [Halomonas desiderata]